MNALKISFQVLNRFQGSPGQNLKLLLQTQLARHESAENRQITRIVYGVIRREETLSAIIRQQSNRPLHQIDSDTLIQLKIAVYLLLFSDATPDHAVVNETVSAARTRSRGFVNAVLRQTIRRRSDIRKNISSESDPGIRFSISDLLLHNLKRISENLIDNLEYLNREPVFHLKSTAGEKNRQRIRTILSEKSLPFKSIDSLQTEEVIDAGRIIHEVLASESAYFQNTGSQLVSLISAQFARHKVLDCCAAPGTKSLTLSQMNNNLHIVANDINRRRIQLLSPQLERFKLSNVDILCSDIKQAALKGVFDFYLVDAPCSAAGTIRKNPDLKLKIDEATIQRNQKEQRAILSSIVDLAIPGSHILYSVCSFIKEESEDVIAWLGQHHPVEEIRLDSLLRDSGFSYFRGQNGYFLLPNDGLNNDLFFISLIKTI